MAEEFGGDVLLFDTQDGAEITIFNGLISMDKGFNSAVYLSLFGGDKDDTGEVVNNNTWWGNKIQNISENEKLVSRFQAFITSVPLISKNVKLAEGKVIQDLQWMIDDGIADSIEAEIQVVGRKDINLKIVIAKFGEVIEAGNYSLQWGAMKNGI